MKLQTCAKTDIGLKRSNNEDLFFIDEEQGLFIIADGMGGHAAGEVASQIAVETVCQSLQAPDLNTPHEQLKLAIEEANLAVGKAANSNHSWQGMGTTLTVLLLHQQQAFLAHVGDSRAYRFVNQQLEQLSDDHSLSGERLRQGMISAEEAHNSTFGNILLQAVGISEKLDICLKHYPLTAGERFLLCSDGLSDMLTDAEIGQILRESGSVNTLCGQFVNQAIVAGGKDNITVMMIQIDEI